MPTRSHNPTGLSRCPVCADHMKVVKLRCPACDLAVEGDLPSARLGLLSPEHQRFIEIFVAARGNIKEVEKRLGISYPTVRRRLDEVISSLGTVSPVGEQSSDEILKALERGEITAREAAERLRRT